MKLLRMALIGLLSFGVAAKDSSRKLGSEPNEAFSPEQPQPQARRASSLEEMLALRACVFQSYDEIDKDSGFNLDFTKVSENHLPGCFSMLSFSNNPANNKDPQESAPLNEKQS